jgi:tetratricopeptide (TPR) repeat protein/tRNA A-37 threonylcarbamoyl transferase component Bud32
MSADLRQQLQSSLGTAYSVERELGGGGMSRTYVAHETALGRKVVVKMLSPELAAGVSVERFKREIQLAATLQHPHVVPVLATGDANGLPWFTMPYVEGESLRARLGNGPLRTAEATAVLKDVARALEFAHAHGVVHRDIKPDNVLLAGSSATVTDFGIAKALTAARDGAAEGGALTMTGTTIGTPVYMAPEQAAGDPNVDQRSDIYSFGVLAFELLTGRPPFDGSSPVKLMQAHFSDRPPDVRELRPDVPPTLAELVARCLEKQPENRPQSASDVVRVLETVTSSGAAEEAPLLLQPQMRLGRGLVVWAIASFVVALTAWAATNTIGLPDWVFPGSLGVMIAGLPAILVTWYVQRTARRAYTSTPVFTTGGSPSRQGTIATIALKASPHVSWRRTWMTGAITVGAFAVLVVGFMVMRAFGIGPAGSLIGAGKLSKQEQLILTDFKSPATDSTLGVTVTEALRADLAQSSALVVVPRLSMNETLKLMQRPADTRIDFGVAREIATREGVKAVLDGEVVSLGGRYVLSARLLSAQSGEQLAAFSEQASSQNDLIPALGRLSKQLRAKVGESLKSVHDATSLERVTTGSMEALSKYTAALTTLEQTGEMSRAVALLEQAVAIDSTFAMAWRRLSVHLWSLGQFDRAAKAVTQAYRYRDRLSEVERHLTEAQYFDIGPEVDQERALEAYEAAIAIDSTNLIALNNTGLLLVLRRDYDRAARDVLKAVSQDKQTPNPITWGNALSWLSYAGRISAADSLMKVWTQRAPNLPTTLFAKARMALFTHRDLDGAEPLYVSARSNGALVRATSDLRVLMMVRGRLHEGFQFAGEEVAQRTETRRRIAQLNDDLDSAAVIGLVAENRTLARLVLHRALDRTPLDSMPLIERPYDTVLRNAAFVGDTALARQAGADNRRRLAAAGKTLDRGAQEAYTEALVAFSAGRYDDALAKLDTADRRLHPCMDCVAGVRFLALDRLGKSDSAIAAGEAYTAIRYISPRSFINEALFRPGIDQRLGELYEAKGMPEKALPHYEELVERWKKADPELQPRVRDIRARIDRIRAQIAKKG